MINYLELQDKIKYDGRLRIFTRFDGEVVLQVDWYYRGIPCGYDESFGRLDLNNDRVELFIERANVEIERMLATKLTHIECEGVGDNDGFFEL